MQCRSSNHCSFFLLSTLPAAVAVFFGFVGAAIFSFSSGFAVADDVADDTFRNTVNTARIFFGPL
jgi:hypothetical protein